ncbi:PhoH family protein [Salsuginibacillus kocurii]|uniref:PhoH family protein n=1 Tax=Salsuginibacillus kocurii TaxID=427078 RepID=UPI000361A19E|nr:PhoH family protein [Salsuginibacillus kocurii]
MKKIYVLDTNVLLQDPRSLFAFQEHEVIIPAVVLEEIDAKKRYMDELGRNARYVARLLDGLRLNGRLDEGIPLDSGGTLRVELNHRSFQYMRDRFPEMTNDNRLLAVAMNLQMEERQNAEPKPVIIVSKDALVRIKGEALELKTEDFLHDRVIDDDHIYEGFKSLSVSKEILDQFYQTRSLHVSEITDEPVSPHECFIMKDAFGSSTSALGKVSKDGKELTPVEVESEQVWGIRPRNVQQRIALSFLLDPSISVLTMTGKAGTGKTLLALAAGLLQTEDLAAYKKLLVARPVVPLGKDIGYLPGEKEEKLRPWMQPIFDNLEFLFNTKKPGELDEILVGMGSIQVEALTYIRGRSLPDQFIIIDEAQNLTKHEVKTILTRVGEGSKIVLMGDPAQIDHPYLDERTNGLTYVVERFKHEAVSAHIKLEKGERSGLAQLAADLL